MYAINAGLALAVRKMAASPEHGKGPLKCLWRQAVSFVSANQFVGSSQVHLHGTYKMGEKWKSKHLSAIIHNFLS